MNLIWVLAGGAAVVSTFAHVTLYRWALRTWPRLARSKRGLAVALAVLFFWPAGRLLVRVSWLPAPARALAQLGTTWHLFVGLAMVPFGLASLAAAGARRASRFAARRRDGAPAGATTGGAPVGRAGEAAPPTSPALPRADVAPGPTRGAGLASAPLSGGPASVSPVDAAPAVAPRGDANATTASPARDVAAAKAPAGGAAGRTNAAGAFGRRRFVEAAGGLGALAASGGALGWGLRVNRFDWHVEEVPVRLPRLPRALDGFTVVQVSDLHVGPLWRERELRQGLALVEALRPDLVVVTGDIIDYDPAYVPLAARVLGALRAREGVAFVPGNHDYYAGVGEITRGLAAAGLEPLTNRGRVVAPRDGGGFALMGVDEMLGTHWGLGPDLATAQASVPAGLATVLLAHQPDFFYWALRAGGVDLQLSGHTHGGQINPGFVPARLLYRFIAGRYERQASTLYVNRGFGTVGPPLRAGAPPEITKLVLLAG